VNVGQLSYSRSHVTIPESYCQETSSLFIFKAYLQRLITKICPSLKVITNSGNDPYTRANRTKTKHTKFNNLQLLIEREAGLDDQGRNGPVHQTAERAELDEVADGVASGSPDHDPDLIPNRQREASSR
jgi:hypothetical protein